MNTYSSASKKTYFIDIVSGMSNISTANSLAERIDTYAKNFNLDSNLLYGDICDIIDKTSDIRNVGAFVSKISYDLVMNHKEKYKKQRLTLYFHKLFEELDNSNVVGETWEKFFIEMIENHAVNEFTVTVEELKELNHSIVCFLNEKNLRTFNYFIECFKKSKLITSKCAIPYNELEARAKEQGEEWDNVMEELSNGNEVFNNANADR